MRLRDFDIKKEGNVYHVTRDLYPRMSLKIDLTNTMAELRDIVILDNCSAADIKQILSSLEDLIRALSD